jgi:hypothetical protein
MYLVKRKIFVSELIPLETLEMDEELFKKSFIGYVSKFIENDKLLSKLSSIDHIINLAYTPNIREKIPRI